MVFNLRFWGPEDEICRWSHHGLGVMVKRKIFPTTVGDNHVVFGTTTLSYSIYCFGILFFILVWPYICALKWHETAKRLRRNFWRNYFTAERLFDCLPSSKIRWDPITHEIQSKTWKLALVNVSFKQLHPSHGQNLIKSDSSLQQNFYKSNFYSAPQLHSVDLEVFLLKGEHKEWCLVCHLPLSDYPNLTTMKGIPPSQKSYWNWLQMILAINFSLVISLS